MADNTQISLETTGDLVATDDIEGVKYQRMKVVLGADGVNDGDISSANPMPVNILSSLVPTAYDYIALTYTDTDLTKAEYYTGGSTGTKVATLTMTYTAHVMQTVTKT